MKIICTVCSRHKKETPGLLPAGERYTGAHIAAVQAIAADTRLPLYFLSGKYGLISESAEIPYYDYYLEDGAADALVTIVVDTIRQENVSEIEFYWEDKASWAPYKKVIETAANETGAALHLHRLP